jgi:hypothetical protein
MGSNASTADMSMVHLYGASTATNFRVLPSSEFALLAGPPATHQLPLSSSTSAQLGKPCLSFMK